MKIPLAEATVTEQDREILAKAVESGSIFKKNEIEMFENVVAESIGAAGAVATSSGSAALHIALCAIGIKPGDEIILPSYTCVALLNAISLCRAKPVLIDNKPYSSFPEYHPSVNQIKNAMSKKTRAVIVSHMFGSLMELEDLNSIDVPVIEDFSLSVGAQKNNKMAGSFGTIGVASFHWSKMVSTVHGGILVSPDESILDKARTHCHYDHSMDHIRILPENKLRGKYELAFNYKMTPIGAAFGRSQWSQLNEFVNRRIFLANHYTSILTKAQIKCPVLTKDRSNVFHRYMISVPNKVVDLINRLQRRGIEIGRGVYPPLHVLLDLDNDAFPNTMGCVNSLLSLPIYPSISDSKIEFLLNSVIEEIKLQ
jgi:dTDP-4-amino-4,6-dideoxygalactose transaminase